MASKRRRNAAFSKTQMGSNSDENIQMSGLSITDLPSAIVVEIVLKLPTKSIVICKSVCKTWYDLISDPHFAKVHLDRSKTCTLIRNIHRMKFSRRLYLLEPGDVCSPDSGYCFCRADGAERCIRCRPNSAVRAKLKIPVRNPRVMLEKVKDRCRSAAAFCVGTTRKSRRLIKLQSPHPHRYDIVNTCNGLICLARTRLDLMLNATNGVVICNPILGEFAKVLEDRGGFSYFGSLSKTFGLGFSPKQKEYKVIRICTQWKIDHVTGLRQYSVAEARIHTLGTDLWSSVDISAFKLGHFLSPAYLNGALHWLFEDEDKNYQLATFDLDNERFHVRSVPAPPPYNTGQPKLAIRVLGGRLYLYTNLVVTCVYIWVMDGNGIFDNSWTMLFSADVSEFHSLYSHHRHHLISCLGSEAMVMFGGPRNEFSYYDRSEGLRFKQLKFHGLATTYFEVTSFTPSFVSLKDVVVMEGNAEVHNVSSGCGKLKLEVHNVSSVCGKLKLVEETYPLMLQGGRN